MPNTASESTNRVYEATCLLAFSLLLGICESKTIQGIGPDEDYDLMSSNLSSVDFMIF